MKSGDKIIIARYGEIHLKGDNRGHFLRALIRNLKAKIECNVTIDGARVLVDSDKNEILKKTACTFGIVSASFAIFLKGGAEQILEYLKSVKISGTFKVEVNRADKNFPMKSPEFAALAGAGLLEANKIAVVDVVNPETVISIDIRPGGTFIYDGTLKGMGGLPVGTAGRALVMLSGGIDSPVAAWLCAKRGLDCEFIHFYSPPHTSEFALEKVRKLILQLKTYTGAHTLHIVPFTEIQEAIRVKCDNEFMITLMRRFMVRIAERFAQSRKIDCIITGESLGQVASQTVQSIATNNVCASSLPILRPLITYDKNEIINLAKQINTYDISIEPFEDCCTVFVPRHPSTKPSTKKAEFEERKLDTDALIERAINNIRCEQIK